MNSPLVRAGYGGWLIYTAASAGDSDFIEELIRKDPLIVFGEGDYGVTDVLYAAAKSKDRNVFRLVFDSASSPGFSTRKDGDLEELKGKNKKKQNLRFNCSINCSKYCFTRKKKLNST